MLSRYPKIQAVSLSLTTAPCSPVDQKKDYRIWCWFYNSVENLNAAERDCQITRLRSCCCYVKTDIWLCTEWLWWTIFVNIWSWTDSTTCRWSVV